MAKEETVKNVIHNKDKPVGTFLRMEPSTRGKLELFMKEKKLGLGESITVLVETYTQQTQNTNIMAILQSIRNEFDALKKEHRFQTEIIIRSQGAWIRKNAMELAKAVRFTAPLVTPKDFEIFERMFLEQMEEDSVKSILYGNVRYQEVENRVRNNSSAEQNKKDKATVTPR